MLGAMACSLWDRVLSERVGAGMKRRGEAARFIAELGVEGGTEIHCVPLLTHNAMPPGGGHADTNLTIC